MISKSFNFHHQHRKISVCYQYQSELLASYDSSYQLQSTQINLSQLRACSSFHLESFETKKS